MKTIGKIAIVAAIAAGGFVAGFAVGAPSSKKPIYTAFETVTWDDLKGPKMANLSGNYKKGSYIGLLKIPAGFTSPLHTHAGAYEAVQIMGTSTHWLDGEDGSAATKMTPGSYWFMPAKAKHVSSCAAGTDCVMLLIQKTKFDFKEATPKAGATPASPPATKTPPPATKTPAPAPTKP